MKSIPVLRVKICRISSVGEASLAIKLGASALGMVIKMPSGPGIISESQITEIIKTVPPIVSTFLLTSKRKSKDIIIQQRKTQATTIQLVDSIDYVELLRLRFELPWVKIVQVIHVQNNESIIEAKSVEPFVDGLLLDSGNPNLEVKILGGTGVRHNWEISKLIREEIKIPVFLAGGLNSDNVEEAIETVRPFGLDICSGVRTNGWLDEDKLKEFFSKVNIANSKLFS